MGHARLSPSNHRWPHCPGSVREEQKYPDVSGEAAIDGTGTHLLLEICAKSDSADFMLGKNIGAGHPDKIEGWTIDQDRINRVNDALAYLRRRESELGDDCSLETESRSNPGETFGRNDWYGTCDLTLISPKQGVLEVIDYKDGRGFVSADDNSQLVSYAGGKIGRYFHAGADLGDCPIKTVRMTIVQPKTNPVVRHQEISLLELWHKLHDLSVAAHKTDHPEAPLISGWWCQWCKHRDNCPEKATESVRGLQTMTQHVDGKGSMIEAIRAGEVSAGTMSNEQLAAIKDVEKVVKKLIDQVDAEMFNRLKEGQEIVGYAIGNARNKKVWNEDEEKIVKRLTGMRLKKDEVLIPTLISPAQALKHEGLSDRQRANLEKLIDTEPGREKVVEVKVEQKKKTAEEMFGQIENKPVVPNFM